jgi:hypothetical protein
LPIVAPVTKPTAVVAGSPSTSTSHWPAMCSSSAAAGDITVMPAF